jgi:LmbE family N-acetylglucosaminyl deacetylase
MNEGAMARPGRPLPDWRHALVVVAHPDDETFGLGAIAGSFTAGGAAVHVLCFTHGEASTLNENHTGLRQARARELRQAAAELGVVTVTLLDYPDGHLAAVPPGELSGDVARLAARRGAEGLLVFDDTGITGHPDHQAATRAAVSAAEAADLPVLAWALQGTVADRLREETGEAFRASRRTVSTCASGWTGPLSAAQPSCTPARSHPPPSCGGGCNCKATASTCAGCCHPESHGRRRSEQSHGPHQRAKAGPGQSPGLAGIRAHSNSHGAGRAAGK